MHSALPNRVPPITIRLRPRVSRRRGKAAVIVLAVLALLSLLIAIGGAFAAFNSGAGTAFTALMKQVKALAGSATEFDCPGTSDLTVKKGGALFLVVPDDTGRVADPKQGTAFTLTVADASGNNLKVEMNQGESLAQGQLEVLGFVEFPADGTYTVTAAATDGASTARIAVIPGTPEDFGALQNFAQSVGIGSIGGCAGVCGLVLALGFGIGALVVGLRKPSQAAERDPLAL